MPTLTLNQVDPSKTLAIRKKYANQQRRIFAAAVASSQTALANLPENPTQNQIDNYLAALLALLMLNITSGNAVYPYVQAAYLRGVTNANLDLRAGGLSVVGAETAVLTQAVHRFSLQARQDSTQAMIRDVYMGTVNNVGNEISMGGERPLPAPPVDAAAYDDCIVAGPWVFPVDEAHQVSYCDGCGTPLHPNGGCLKCDGGNNGTS